MAEVTEESIRQFARLFRGRDDAFGTGKGKWVKRAITEADYAAHLRGDGPGLGVAPLMDDGTVHFAAIDLDAPDFETAQAMQEFIPGHSIIERSRSGNAHVWVFFAEPVRAYIPRGILKLACEAAGKEHVEVFPKQDQLNERVKLGNYINLPYHGEDRPALYWRQDGSVGDYPLSRFLEIAGAHLNSADNWKKRALWLQITPPEDRPGPQQEFGTAPRLHQCAEYIVGRALDGTAPITEGHRSQVYLALFSQFANCALYDDDETWDIITMVNDASPDPVPESELRRIFGNVKRGQYTSTRCDDPLVAPFADPKCRIAQGNV